MTSLVHPSIKNTPRVRGRWYAPGGQRPIIPRGRDITLKTVTAFGKEGKGVCLWGGVEWPKAVVVQNVTILELHFDITPTFSYTAFLALRRERQGAGSRFDQNGESLELRVTDFKENMESEFPFPLNNSGTKGTFYTITKVNFKKYLTTPMNKRI